MVLTEELLIDPSKLIGPLGATVHFLVMDNKVPLVTPDNYSPTNIFIIGRPTSVGSQSLSKNMAKPTVSPEPQPTIKPVLINLR